MTCLINNEENNHSVEELAKKLSQHYDQNQQKFVIDESEIPSNAKIAYFLLACNNGYQPEQDTENNKSSLYNSLLDLYGGDERQAIIAKSYIYTPQFIEEYGDWMQNGEKEPDFSKIEPESFKKAVAEYFPDASDRSLESIDQFYQDLFYSYIFGDREINGYNPAINKNSIYSTITEDRDHWVEKQLNQNPVPDDQRVKKIRELRRKYNQEKLDYILRKIKNRFLEQWGLKENPVTGLVQNPLLQKDFKEYEGLSPYWVFEFRCRFLNSLFSRATDPTQMTIVSQMIKDFLRGSDASIMTENAFDKYLEIYKDSDIFKQALVLTGYLEEKNDGTPTKSSTGKAIDALKKEFKEALYDYTTGSYKNSFQRRVGQIVRFFKNLTKAVFRWGIKINKTSFGVIPMAVTTGAVALIPGINAAIPIIAGISARFLINSTLKEVEKKIRIKSEDSTKYHQSVRDFLLAFAINDTLEPSYDTTISDILFEMKGNNVDILLQRLLNNINIQLKSAKSRAEQNYSSTSQIQELESLKTLCENAISSRLNPVKGQYELSQFLTQYLKIAKQKLQNSNEFLLDAKDKLNKGDIDGVDIHKLMRIKTDIIGAYTRTISNYINRQKSNIDINSVIIESIKDELNGTRILFSEVLDSYLKSYTHEFLKETSSKTLKKPYANRLETNMQKWFESQIDNGNLTVFDKYIFAARTSTSPIVRMAHQKLAEIETTCLAEAGQHGALIEEIRSESRKLSSRGFFNPMNRYAERTKDGKFTGNFVSDVNLGQYEQDFYNIKQKLIKKHHIKTLPSGEKIWDDGDNTSYAYNYKLNGVTYNYEMSADSDANANDPHHITKWQAYNIDLILWMAGAEQDEDGTFILKETSIPRVRRRYKYQYYLDKTLILGKDGCDKLADINRQIQELYKECSIKVKIGDKERLVPIFAKLSNTKRIFLKRLINEKNQLSNTYSVHFDDNMKNIIGIEEKTEIEKRLALKFFLWDRKKQEYYSYNENPDYTLYDEVLKYYDDLINNAKTESEKEEFKRQKFSFEKDSTRYQISHKLQSLFGKSGYTKYDLTDDNTREYLNLVLLRKSIKRQIESSNEKRTPDLKKIGKEGDPENIRQLWLTLVNIDQQIYDLKNKIGIKTIDEESVAGEEGKIDRDKYITQENVPLLDDNENETRITFAHYLTSVPELRLSPKDLQYETLTFRNPYSTFLKYSQLDEIRAMKVKDGKGGMLFESTNELYELRPTGMFADSKSLILDEKFDEEKATNDIQVNKERKEYDNTKHYNEVKDDKIYQNLLKLMDEAWKNYPGFTRANRYRMPQRIASVSSMFGRSFITKRNSWNTFKSAFEYSFSNMFNFNANDVDVNNQILTRADGTTVETIPSRYISRLDDPNMIDTDLVSSVVDFYNESLRFKYRSKLEPVMEAVYFKLSGGFEKSSDAGSRSQAQSLRGEMSRALYGRSLTGSGEGGRITESDARIAKLSKTFRSALHKRLMSHNWLSVLKNGYDSFCNLLTAAYTGKLILTQNLINGILHLFIDLNNSNLSLFTQLGGINRSKATNMTQALMQLNGVNSTIHERFKDQNKWYIRRLLDKSSTIEFEFVDYTSKAILTEAVYDSYRLIFNPVTQKYEFMNENQAEYAYETRKAGWEAWNKAKKYTLRNCYKQNEKTGVAELIDTITIIDNAGKKINLNVLDLVRPKSKISISDDSRSRSLENQIRTTIKQMSQTINGMLDEEDKNELAKNYAGAILVSFRGWMISQAGEYYKTGTDFYNWENDTDSGKSISQLSKFFVNTKREGGIDDYDYVGQFNFATGTIDNGLHVNLWKNLKLHVIDYLQMMSVVGELFGDTKSKHLKKMSQSEYYQLRNFAAATDFMIITIALTALAFQWYDGGDDEEDKNDTLTITKSLVFTAALASISERFPQLGTIPFLSSATDLIKAATVGVTLFDDAHYVLDSAMNLGDYIQNMLTESGIINGDSEQTGEQNTFDVLVNGSFKGETKAKRDFIKALALFNVDTLPILLAMDALTSFDGVPEKMQETKYRDFNLNYRKSTTDLAQKGLRKFYKDIIPAGLLNAPMQQIGFPITDQKQESVSKSSSASNSSTGNLRQKRSRIR